MMLSRSSVVFVLTSLFITNSLAQFKEISVVSDNDAYMLHRHDGYYTSGFKLGIIFADKKNSSSLISIGLGQELFTPGLRDFLDSSSVDRPYAGHLYMWLSKNMFYHPRRLYFWILQAGVVGRYSFGQDVQNLLHRWVQLGEIIGWEYQIPNMLSLTLSGGWAQELYTNTPAKFPFKIIMQSNLTAGTTYVNVTTGAYFVLGKINSLSSSSLFNARCLASTNLDKELYFFLHPSLIWQGHDATIQGSWLKPPSFGITREPTSFLFTNSFGVVYANKKLSVGLEAICQTRSTTTQLRPHAYGSITLAYRWE